MRQMLSERRPIGVITYRGTNAADTKDVEPLADGILDEVQAEVRRTGAGAEFRFTPMITGYDNLAAQVQLRKATILQIICHASRDGVMSVDDVWGALGLTPESFARLVAGNGIAVVLVTACHGAGIARALVESGAVEAAIGIDLPLKFAGARAFSRGFFRSLARGRTLAEAVADGKGQAAGRIEGDVDHLHLITRDDATAAKVAFVPPTYYVIGSPSDDHKTVIERLRAGLAPDRLLHVDDAKFGEVETDLMLTGIEMAQLVLVLFEGERIVDPKVLEQVVRVIERAKGHGLPVRVFPLYLTGTTPHRDVPFGMSRVTPAYLQHPRYRGDVEKLAADIKALV